MIKDTAITEMLYDKCSKVVTKPGIWNCRCPICGDSKTKPNARRFVINYYPAYDTYMYKCHRCGESGSVYSLCSSLYGISFHEAKKKLDMTEYNPSTIKKIINHVKYDAKDDISNTELDIDLKNECYSVNSIVDDKRGIRLINKLKNFISSRMISDECFIAHSGRYKSRVIVPVINDNKLEYFQARSLDNDIQPKYLNPYVNKTPIIYNKNKISPDKSIIITEGLIDAMSVGSQCTCTLGADISDEKLEVIFSLTKKDVVICSDNDEAGRNSILRTINKSKYAKILKYFIMPTEYSHIKDMNQLLVSHISNINQKGGLENFVISNSYSYFYVKTLFKVVPVST